MLTAKIFLKICCDKLTLGSKNTPQKPVFHTIIFFGRFSPNMAGISPPIFLGKQFFSTAGFELFCRIFGRLATVSWPLYGHSRLRIFHGHHFFKTATFEESGRDNGHLATLAAISTV
jgi:hypothetical protein